MPLNKIGYISNYIHDSLFQNMFMDFFFSKQIYCIVDFFYPKWNFDFFSGFLFLKHNNLLPIYFSIIYYFQFWIFISKNLKLCTMWLKRLGVERFFMVNVI